MLVTNSFVRLLLDALARLGAEPAELLARAGLTKEQLSDPHQRMAPSDFARFQECALELMNDPALGLHLGETTPSSFGVVGQLAVSCRTLRDCIQTTLSYYPLLFETQAPVLVIEEGNCMLRFSAPRGPAAAGRLSTEFAMARFAMFGRNFVATGGHSIEIWFAHERPSYAHEYARLFGTNVWFDKPHSGFVMPTALLDLEQPHWDPAIHQLLRAEADRALRPLSARNVHERAQAVLSSLRLGQRPEMATVARVLGMTERALRRRLASEGVSFRELVDRVQRERALVLAADPRRSAEAVSDALGFSEVSAFHRAFKRWTGITPLRYRLGSRQPEGTAGAYA